MTSTAATPVQRALLVVDVQVGVMAASINSDAVIARISALVDQARAAHVPVIWVRHSDAELVLDSDQWQIVPELVPADDEPIIEKRFGDSFAETDLNDVLQALDVAEIILCGAQTDACIRSTYYGALFRGYGVTLVSDAHTTEDMQPWGAGFTPEQSIAVLNMHAQFAPDPGMVSKVLPADAVFGDVLS